VADLYNDLALILSGAGDRTRSENNSGPRARVAPLPAQSENCLTRSGSAQELVRSG
jgi:hypothetical protein